MGVLSKAEIQAVQDCKRELVHVPEWGGDVYVRVLPGTERDQWDAWSIKSSKREDYANWRSKLCSLCLVDEAGNRLFSDNEMSELSKKSGAVLARLYLICRRVNAFDSRDVEELEKNSESGPSDDSTTA